MPTKQNIQHMCGNILLKLEEAISPTHLILGQSTAPSHKKTKLVGCLIAPENLAPSLS